MWQASEWSLSKEAHAECIGWNPLLILTQIPHRDDLQWAADVHLSDLVVFVSVVLKVLSSFFALESVPWHSKIPPREEKQMK